MCGIAGSVALRPDLPPPEIDDLSAMAAALRHRGPDGFGIYRDDTAGLAHARLAIIDLETGDQPMANETDSLWVVFNGEIFNYVELRAELVERGHVFRSRSDTEVIVHAYEAWGDAAFERFNGQFSLALWDATSRELVLARDRHGVHPLYLAEHAGRLWFASEVKALFAGAPSLPRRLDPAGLAETFTFWTTVPPQTVFDGVTELEPGHVRHVAASGIRQSAFSSVQFPSANEQRRVSMEDAAAELRDLLERAVALRILRADVRVGAYLSGGLDSSIVATLGRLASGSRLETFSLRFDDREFDETRFQRLVASRIASVHHEVIARPAQIAASFPDAIWHAERPILRTAPVAMSLLSGLVHECGIKVVLTGEGADEMFGGYDLFRESRVRRFWARRPESALRPRLIGRLYPYLSRSPSDDLNLARAFFGRDLARAGEPGFGHRPRWRTTAALQRLFSADVRSAASESNVESRLLATLPREFGSWASLAQDQYLEIRTLLSGYLLSSQGDRVLMAHSVEGRFPYLDAEVVRFAESLPDDMKLRRLEEKAILKRLGADLVPDLVRARPKQPFRAPDAVSFFGSQSPEWVDDMLDPGEVRRVGVFDPVAVDRLARKCRAAIGARPLSNSDNMAIVGVLSTTWVSTQFVSGSPDRRSAVGARIVDRAGSLLERGVA